MPTPKTPATEADTVAAALSAFDEGVQGPGQSNIPDDPVEEAGAADDLDGLTAEEVEARERAGQGKQKPDDAEDGDEPAAGTGGKPKAPAQPFDPEKAIAEQRGKGGKGKKDKAGEPAAGEPKPGEKPADDKTGKPADGKDGDGKPKTPEEQAAADKAATDAEAKQLGLKEGSDAHKRFQELANSARTHERRWQELGGDEGVQRLRADAADMAKWDEHLERVGATSEQVGQAFGYIAAFNSNDPAVLTQAYDNLQRELYALGARIGRSPGGEGAPDLLAEFPELKAKVEAGKMDREDALAWIADKKATALRAEQQQSQRQAEDARAVEDRAVSDLRALGASLKARDGDDLFGYRMKVATPLINAMQRHNPPASWKALAAEIYEKIEKPQPAPALPAQTRHTSSSVRHVPGGGAGAVVRKPANPIDAFDMGVEEARERGE